MQGHQLKQCSGLKSCWEMRLHMRISPLGTPQLSSFLATRDLAMWQMFICTTNALCLFCLHQLSEISLFSWVWKFDKLYQNTGHLPFWKHGSFTLHVTHCRNCATHTTPQDEPVVAWTTVSTTLAKAEQPKNVEIPPKFHQYGKVFLDKEAQQLPKHQPWDHKIDLILGMEMKKTTVYHLTPIEKVTLKEYIEDGLKRGTLYQSKAPHTCSFFFIDKKDGKLWPVQDYHPLNAITVKNAAPIPLIPKLVDKLLEVWFFTKLDIWWGYNNIWVHEGDEWKMAFKTPMGLYESTVMTFRLCNAPATFQTFMDIEFGPLIKEGHVVVYLNDILIYTTTITELIYWMHKVFQLYSSWTCTFDLPNALSTKHRLNT